MDTIDKGRLSTGRMWFLQEVEGMQKNLAREGKHYLLFPQNLTKEYKEVPFTEEEFKEIFLKAYQIAEEKSLVKGKYLIMLKGKNMPRFYGFNIEIVLFGENDRLPSFTNSNYRFF